MQTAKNIVTRKPMLSRVEADDEERTIVRPRPSHASRVHHVETTSTAIGRDSLAPELDWDDLLPPTVPPPPELPSVIPLTDDDFLEVIDLRSAR